MSKRVQVYPGCLFVNLNLCSITLTTVLRKVRRTLCSPTPRTLPDDTPVEGEGRGRGDPPTTLTQSVVEVQDYPTPRKKDRGVVS